MNRRPTIHRTAILAIALAGVGLACAAASARGGEGARRGDAVPAGKADQLVIALHATGVAVIDEAASIRRVEKLIDRLELNPPNIGADFAGLLQFRRDGEVIATTSFVGRIALPRSDRHRAFFAELDRLLAKHGADAAGLIDQLENEDDQIRYAASNALRSVPRDEVGAVIAAAATLPRAEVRASLCTALGDLAKAHGDRDGSIVEALRRAAREDDSEVKDSALKALLVFGRDAEDAHLHALSNPDPEVQETAAYCLSTLGTKVPAKLVAPLLGQKDRNYHFHAIEALKTTDDPEAAPLLLEVVKDGDDYHHRHSAGQILNRLLGTSVDLAPFRTGGTYDRTRHAAAIATWTKALQNR